MILKKVLLLGGNGFVGSNIVDYFQVLPDIDFYFTSRKKSILIPLFYCAYFRPTN